MAWTWKGGGWLGDDWIFQRCFLKGRLATISIISGIHGGIRARGSTYTVLEIGIGEVAWLFQRHRRSERSGLVLLLDAIILDDMEITAREGYQFWHRLSVIDLHALRLGFLLPPHPLFLQVSYQRQNSIISQNCLGCDLPSPRPSCFCNLQSMQKKCLFGSRPYAKIKKQATKRKDDVAWEEVYAGMFHS